jgi:serine/threonine protein kinase/WD40 repeat protein
MSETRRNPIDELAEEFVERYRRGERPAISEYTKRHPDLAGEIHEVFPALVMIEEAAPEERGSPAVRAVSITADGRPLEQLGDYHILRQIGCGGMGVVYEAVQEALGRHVALKVLPFAFSNDPTHLKRFRREARSAARLHHTNIVPVFDIGESRGIHYYAMQFIQGQGLDEVLQELRRLRGFQSPINGALSPDKVRGDQSFSLATGLLTGQFGQEDLPDENQELGNQRSEVSSQKSEPGASATGASDIPADSNSTLSLIGGSSEFSAQSEYHFYPRVARVGLQVAEALAYAHGQKVLHRDIKPSNLLLDLQGTIWVTDFGLAKEEESDDLTRTGDIVGTLRYMAPERFSGQADRRSDIYSLGMTLFELLTLRPAFEEMDRARLIQRITGEEPLRPRKIDARIPRDLETIVCKAIAKEPADRYPTAEALAEDFRRFLADRPIRARRASTFEQTLRWCRRNPVIASLSASVAALLVVVAIGSLVTGFLREERDLARANQQRAENAEMELRVAEQELKVRSHLARAVAYRMSHRQGQRFPCLDELKEAAKLNPSPELQNQLRNQAIACLALPDLRVGKEWDNPLPVPVYASFDDKLERCLLWDHEGKIRIYQMADNKEIYKLTDTGWVLLSPDGRFLAIGSQNRVKLRQLVGPEPVAVKPDLITRTVMFSPDSRKLAVGYADGSIGIHELPSGQRLRMLPSGASPDWIAFDPQGQRLAVSHRAGVQIRDVENGKMLTELAVRGGVDQVVWHPKENLLAAANRDGSIGLWDLASRKLIAKLPGHHNGGVRCAFNHAGDLLASSAWDAVLRLWDVRLAKEIFATPCPWIPYPQFTPDDRFLGAPGEGGKLRFFEVAAGKEYRTLVRDPVKEKGAFLRAAVSPDGRALAVAMREGLGFWDLSSGRELAFAQLGNTESVSFETDRALLTFGDQGLFRWPISGEDMAEGCVRIGPPERLPAPGSWTQMAQSQDGQVVAIGRYNQGGLVLHRSRSNATVTLSPHEDVRHIGISPDGHWVATGSHGANLEVKVWDASNGKVIKSLPVGGGARVAFSPDNRWLAASGDAIRVWEVGSWKECCRCPGTARASVAFSPDNMLLAYGDLDGVIQLVNPETGRQYARLEDPSQHAATDICFSPDGTQLIAISTFGPGIHVWDLRSIRAQLDNIGLDWDAPPYVSTNPNGSCLRSIELFHQLKVPKFFEAEDLKIIKYEDSLKAPGCQEMALEFDATQWSNGRQLFWASRKGSYVDLEVELEEAGDYELDIYITKAPDFGTLRVFVDGKALETTFDAFHKYVVPPEKVNFGKATLTKGAHTLRFQAVDKNPQSSNYYMGIDCLVFTPMAK